MTVRTLGDLLSRLSNARHGNEAQDLRDLAESTYPETPTEVSGSMYLTSDLTSAEDPIVWDAIGDDVGGAVDLVNNGFVAQSTGLKIVTLRLAWTATIPNDMDVLCKIDGTNLSPAYYLLRRFRPEPVSFMGHVSTIAVWVEEGEALTFLTTAGTQVAMRGNVSRALATEIIYHET